MRCDDLEYDWDFANLYLPEAFNTLRRNAQFLVSFDIAPRDIDLKEVGDIVLSSNMGHVAFRVRRPNVQYRDLTIRSRRLSRAETEIDKIRKGFGAWYLYAWADGKMPDGNRKFKDWILVDLNQFRDCGLAFEDKEEKPNVDRVTWFFPYSDDELELYHCIVAKSNSRIRRNGHAKWITWEEIKKECPTASFCEVAPDAVAPGDIYQFRNVEGKLFIAKVMNVSGKMIQVGVLSWVEVSPNIGKVTLYRKED